MSVYNIHTMLPPSPPPTQQPLEMYQQNEILMREWTFLPRMKCCIINDVNPGSIYMIHEVTWNGYIKIFRLQLLGGRGEAVRDAAEHELRRVVGEVASVGRAEEGGARYGSPSLGFPGQAYQQLQFQSGGLDYMGGGGGYGGTYSKNQAMAREGEGRSSGSSYYSASNEDRRGGWGRNERERDSSKEKFGSGSSAGSSSRDGRDGRDNRDCKDEQKKKSNGKEKDRNGDGGRGRDRGRGGKDDKSKEKKDKSHREKERRQ